MNRTRLMKFFFWIFLLFLISSCGKESEKKTPQKREGLPTTPNIDTEVPTEDLPPPPIEEERIDELTFYRDSTYLAKFNTLNSQINGNVPGSATLHFKEEKIYAYVRIFAGFPNAWHQQKIYDGSRCPTLEDDLNGDGFLDINEVEKITGNVLIPLDANISSQKAGKNIYPVGDESGNYFYERITKFESFLRDLKSEDSTKEDNIIKLGLEESLIIESRPVVIFGVGPEVSLPETVSSYGQHKPFQTFPIVCGILQKVHSFPGEVDTGEIPGPIEEIETSDEIEVDDQNEEIFN